MIGNLTLDSDSDDNARIILKKSGLAKLVITSLMPIMKGELAMAIKSKTFEKNIETICFIAHTNQ